MNLEPTNLLASGLDFVIFMIPIAAPIFLIILIWDFWTSYTKTKFINEKKWSLLRINPPAEVKKSPAAMELFLLSLYQAGGAANWWEEKMKGKFRTWFSLEIVSNEGEVSFYIHCESKLKTYIESQLYAQFPAIEIEEQEHDYAAGFTNDGDKYQMIAAELKLTKPDPYPIKTYIDYALDEEQDDEYKIDPITPVLEFLSTVEKENHVWIQIIVRAHKKEDPDPKKLFPSFSEKIDNWDKTAKDEIKKIIEETFHEFEEKDGTKRKVLAGTEGQKKIITALERSISKASFDTGIRLVYIAESDKFNSTNIGGMFGAFKQYNSPELNGFKLRTFTNFDFPWQDIFHNQRNKMRAEMLESYKRRQYFEREYYEKTGHFFIKSKTRPYFVLNTEELATIFHFPGKVSEAPSFAKVDSKKGAPPSNLPTE